jgi:hypothetical protein
MTIPSPGRVVHFRSRTGNYTVPAIVTANQGTLFAPAVEAGNIPDITGANRVHLAVMTPGIPSTGRANAKDFIAPIPEGRPVGENQGGTYQEWDVEFWKPRDGSPSEWGIYQEQPAGTWTWPPRI